MVIITHRKQECCFPTAISHCLESTVCYFVFEKSGFISFFPSFQDWNCSRYQAYSLTEWKWWKMRNRVYRDPHIICLYLCAPSPFVHSFQAVIRTESIVLPFGRRWEELSPPGWLAAGQGKLLADRLREGQEVLRRLPREVGIGSESKTTLSLVLCSLEKTCLFQTLLILVHVQLGRCTWRQIWVSAKEGFVCILTSPHVTSNSSLPPWFADTWCVLYLLCQVSHMYTKILCKGSDFIAWLQITLTRGKSELDGNSSANFLSI